MNDYATRKADRIERYRKRAAKARQEGEGLCNASWKMIKQIPLGQPIMIGHHSEKSDRRYRAKAENMFRRSMAADEKADYYEAKAEAAQSNCAISSDDPDALDKLREWLQELVDRQDFMKKVNAYYRKHGTCAGFEDMRYEAATQYDQQVRAGHSQEKQPFPSCTLTNNNANIRRIRQRIEALEKRAATGNTGWVFEGGKVVANVEMNRLQIIFDEIPSPEMRNQLKQNGFRWARSEKAWQRQLTRNALYAIRRMQELAPTKPEV